MTSESSANTFLTRRRNLLEGALPPASGRAALRPPSRPFTLATYGGVGSGVLTFAAIFGVIAAVCIVQTPTFVVAIFNATRTCKADMRAEGNNVPVN